MTIQCAYGILTKKAHKVNFSFIIVGKLNVETESMSAFPVANFDPSGLVFGAAWS